MLKTPNLPQTLYLAGFLKGFYKGSKEYALKGSLGGSIRVLGGSEGIYLESY